jgi:hypothetical protein
MVPAFVAFLSLVGILHAEEPKRSTDDKNVLERFDVAKDGDFLLLPVKFKGKTYQFLLDSGATFNVFDSSLPLGPLKNEIEANSGPDQVRLKLYDAPEATIGGLSLKTPEPVAAFDFTKIREATGYDVYGIVGMPFLRNNVVQVDFDKGELLVLKSPARNCGQGFAVTFKNEAMVARLFISIAGDNEEKVILDTGFNGSGELERETFGSAVKCENIAVIDTIPILSFSGTERRRLGRLKKLALGDLTLRDILVNEAEISKLGLGFCSRFVITFDFPNDKVYLKKGKNFDRPDTHDLSGLYLLRKDGKVVVDSVEQDSAAKTAGFSAGDVLLKVEDMKTNELSMFKLRQQFRAEDKKLPVRVRRGEKEMEIVLTLGRECVKQK